MSVSSQIEKANSRVGRKVGMLQVLERRGANKHRRALFLCRCDCGKELVVPSDVLAKENPSCGCQHAARIAKARTKHGMSDSRSRPKSPRVYTIWKGMLQRCTNKASKSYPWYGGKGITVCAEWREFEGFYRDMGDAPYPDASIDRIDSTKGYEPGNCRWLPLAENSRRARLKQ